MRFATIALLVFCFCTTQSLAESEVDPNIDRAPMDTRLNRANIIGKWYLNQPTTKGGVWRVLSSLNADGSYLMQFEEHLNGEIIQKYSEEGFWGVSGNIHFTITRGGHIDGKPVTVPPERPANYLAYEILELSASTFVYASIVSKNQFQSRKVPEDFQLPPLD